MLSEFERYRRDYDVQVVREPAQLLAETHRLVRTGSQVAMVVLETSLFDSDDGTQDA